MVEIVLYFVLTIILYKPIQAFKTLTVYKVLSEINLGTMFKGVFITNLAEFNKGLYFLRFTLPSVDWRFDFKFDVES